MKKIIMATAVSLLMVGCGDNAPKENIVQKKDIAPKVDRAPECSTNDVKNIIIEGFNTSEEAQKPAKIASLKESMDWHTKNMEVAERDHDFFEFKKSADIYKENKASIQDLNKEHKFNLKKILTESADDRAKKSICNAELHLTRGEKTWILDIDYTAQYTSNGELVVKMTNGTNYDLKGMEAKSKTLVK